MVALLLTGCTSVEPETTTATDRLLTTVTSRSTTTSPLVGGCDNPGRFNEGGEVATFQQEASDSASIGPITWVAAARCQTFTIGFETPEAAPATTPPSARIEYLDPAPVIRVWAAVSGSVITDQLVETTLVERLYVAAAPGGGTFVDLHLAAPAQARVSWATSPGRLVIDLQPGIVESPTRPQVTDDLVLIRPLDTAMVGQNLTVEGYTISPVVVLLVTTEDGFIDEQRVETGAEGPGWTAFAVDMRLPQGEVSLSAGRETDDQGLVGVTVNLTVG